MREEFYGYEGEDFIELSETEMREALEGFDELIINEVIRRFKEKYEDVCDWEMYGAVEMDQLLEEDAILADTKDWLNHIFTSPDAHKDE